MSLNTYQFCTSLTNFSFLKPHFGSRTPTKSSKRAITNFTFFSIFFFHHSNVRIVSKTSLTQNGKIWILPVLSVVRVGWLRSSHFFSENKFSITNMASNSVWVTSKGLLKCTKLTKCFKFVKMTKKFQFVTLQTFCLRFGTFKRTITQPLDQSDCRIWNFRVFSKQQTQNLKLCEKIWKRWKN